ncbi:nuclear transport factor 2 family protein [Ruegeria faecimaris]|uniref:nuclear transport factor 2 family protein n=1 Tax=Ruegeria faecimaris TaxID=686389 RepID=UPI002330D67E|nr:nuclear transport factor 2 family protein [Ruegeria faecimaris]
MSNAVTPSPELVAVIRRWNDAVRLKDRAALMNLLSSSEHLRYQGSADGESWSGQVFRQGFADHTREIPDFSWDEHSLEAFECGDIGWAHCEATLAFTSNGKATLHRFTFVLHLENGVWKMIQMHVSNPTSNMEKIGIEHEALNALIAAARQEFTQDQQEGAASVMFTDIAGSSEITRQVGDHKWTALISSHFDLAENLIHTHGGRLVKSLGDGTMSIFSSVHDAIQAATEFQRENAALQSDIPLGLRVGIHTGDVIQRDEDFFGSVVNKAARVTGLCGANEILVTDVTRLLLGATAGLQFSAPISAQLKGFGGPQTVYRVDWAEP